MRGTRTFWMVTGTRWLCILVGLAVTVGVGLLLLPFSSDNGACGSAAFPRYNRDSPHANERVCADEPYDYRRGGAGVLLLGGLSVVVAMTAPRSVRPG